MSELSTVDNTAALRLWHHIYGDAEQVMAVFSGKRQTPDPKAPLVSLQTAFFHWPADADRALAEVARQDAAGREAYHCAHLLTTQERKKKHAAPILALYTEIDQAADTIPPGLTPTARVASGTLGHFHAYWRLTRAIPPAEAERLNKALVAACGADPGGYDLSQVLRPPGSHNHKSDPPTPVELLHLDEDAVYDPDELAASLGGYVLTVRPAATTTTTVSDLDTPASADAPPPVRLDGEALERWHGRVREAKADGTVDRSASLARLARMLAEANAAEPTIVLALAERDAALGWRKFTDRPDRVERYATEATKAVQAACMPRLTWEAPGLDTARAPETLPPDTKWVPRAWLDKEREDHAATRAELRAANEELAEVKRQQPDALVDRLITQLAPLEAHKPARGTGLPITALLAERAANVAAGKPADTPLYWDGAARAEQFGRDSNTLRKGLNLLEEYKFLDRDYDHLGKPGSGDHRRRVKVTFYDDVPVDVADALNVIRRRVTAEAPRRTLPKRSQGCAPCRTAACPDHPQAPIQRHIRTLCTACGREAAPDHVHEPQAPSREATPAVLHLRSAVVDFGPRLKNSVEPSDGAHARDATENFRAKDVEDVRLKNSVESPPSEDVLDAALDTVERLAADLHLDALPPLKAQALKLKLYQQVVQVLQAGRPAPTAEQVCDQCGSLLAPAEMLRCNGCSTAGVA